MRKRNDDGTCVRHGMETCLDPFCGPSVLAHELRQAENIAHADGSNEEVQTSLCARCGKEITHGGSTALGKTPRWFDGSDDFMCPDGETEHEPEAQKAYCEGTSGHYVWTDNGAKKMRNMVYRRHLVCSTCGERFAEVPGKIGPGNIPLHERNT